MKPLRYIRETVAIFRGVSDTRDILVEITKAFTIWPDGSMQEHAYHYIPFDLKTNQALDIKLIGSIDYDPKVNHPGRFVQNEFGFKLWIKVR